MADNQNMQIKIRCLFLDSQINKDWKIYYLQACDMTLLIYSWWEYEPMKIFLERNLFFQTPRLKYLESSRAL